MITKLNSLDKIAHRKVELLKLLASQSKPSSTTVLSRQLAVSSKTLLTYLKELTHYLEASEEDIQLIKSKDGYYLSKKSSFSMDTLYHRITKDTLFYYLFLYTFHQQDDTIDSYAKVNFFSYSYIYRQIRLMNQLLRPLFLSIELSPLKMNGAELRIRYFFFYYYFYNCNGVDWPFQTIQATDLDNDLHMIEELTAIQFSFIQKEQLRYWLALCQTRYQLNEFIDSTNPFYQLVAQNSPFYQKLLPFMNHFSQKNNLINQQNELYFILFIIHQTLEFPIEDLLSLTEEPLIKKVVHLIEDIASAFPKAKLTTFFKNELFYLVYVSIYLGDSYLELLENNNQQESANDFYTKKIENLLAQNKIDSSRLPCLTKTVTQLIQRHLINSCYQPSIHLFLITKLDGLKKQALYDKIATLPFQLTVTDQTQILEEENVDLILSDYYLPSSSKPVFYWHLFPLKVEWEQLERCLNDIEQQKSLFLNSETV
ncbi:helix-turn-helix domain-containing protein [Carnobacterium divergens]|uniref:helix-turn-helix domain-containing protein n=1 Tax=Carnobacterium divergens TaxID=2748 RepID=UPI001071FDFC|nr:helix-turn-helix domain-containing protein [Carnobacterium divergens]TFI74563.1 hypothetical protein CKN81_03145 [Carnobacterium divergens]